MSVHLAPLLVAILSAAPPDGGLAPPLALGVRAQPTTVQLGEPFEVHVSVSHAPDQRYELVTPAGWTDFEFLGKDRQRTDGASGSITTLTLRMSAFALGELTTPPVSLEVSGPDGQRSTVDVKGTTITVASALPPDAADAGARLYDVRPPEELPVRSWRLVYWALGALLAAAVAYAIHRALRRPRALPVAPPVPVLPPERRAVDALDALAREDLPGQARYKEFYFRLSEITRGYLGERYRFEALECTTPELLHALRTRPTPGLAFEELAAFATASDLYRYSTVTPAADECKRHLELAYRTVHATTAAMAAPPPPPREAPR